VVEVYDRGVVMVRNELLSGVKLTSGRSVLYHGAAVVNRVLDLASMQVLVLFLRDPWIALGCLDYGADNQFEVERFLSFHGDSQPVPPRLASALAGLQRQLSLVTHSLRYSQRAVGAIAGAAGISVRKSPSADVGALDVLVDSLHRCWLAVEAAVPLDDEVSRMRVGEFFKLHVHALCRSSSVFQAFHSLKRLPYPHHRLMSHVETVAAAEGSSSLRAQVLDRFFMRLGCFDELKPRVDCLIRMLTDHGSSDRRPLRVLVLGTDVLAASLIQNGDLTFLERLELDVISFFDEDFDAYRSELESMAAARGVRIRLRVWKERLESCMEDYFCASGSRLSVYDAILAPSLLQGLSDKAFYYLLDYFSQHLVPGGFFGGFSEGGPPSLSRECWWLWFDSQPRSAHCHGAGGSGLAVREQTHPFGQLISFQQALSPIRS
jgi:hypothetical protein